MELVIPRSAWPLATGKKAYSVEMQWPIEILRRIVMRVRLPKALSTLFGKFPPMTRISKEYFLCKNVVGFIFLAIFVETRLGYFIDTNQQKHFQNDLSCKRTLIQIISLWKNRLHVDRDFR